VPYLPSTAAQFSDNERARTAKAFHEACRDIGFLYLKVDSIMSKAEMNTVLRVGHEFFERPQEEKEEIQLLNSDGVRGENHPLHSPK
jgi:isopenicillin N synthase-like dioxygenase